MEKKIERNVSEFLNELTKLLNKYSMENESNTPDFILAQHLINSLHAFETAVNKREGWYGKNINHNNLTNLSGGNECSNCKETVEICECISKNKIIIDGKEYVDENTKVININITGDVDSIIND